MPAPLFIGSFPVILSEQNSLDASGKMSYTKITAYQNGSQVTGVIGTTITVTLGVTAGISANLSAIEVNIANGIAEVSQTFTAGSSTGSATTSADIAVYEVVATAVEEPIASHPAFTQSTSGFSGSIVNASGGAITEGSGASGGAIFNADGLFLGFTKTATNDFTGVQSFLSPRITYRKSYTQNTKPSSGLSATISYIYSNPAGDQPTLASGRNWILTGLNWRQSGKSFEISEEYLASGFGGWNNNIYATAN